MADPEQKNLAQAPVKRAGIERPATAQSTDQNNAEDGEGEAEDRGERVPHMARSLSGNFTQRQRARTLRNDEADTAIANAAPPAEETPRGRGNYGGLAASRWATPPIPAFVARDGSTHDRALNVEADVAELATASVVPPRERRRGRRGTRRAHRRRKSAPPAEPRGRTTSRALAACRWSSASPQSSPSHNEDAAYAFNPLARNICDSFMNQAPLPSRQKTVAYAPSILLVPDAGTQTDPPPAPKTKSWADEMNEAPNGSIFTPISAPSATRPPQIVLGRGGMITPPMIRRYEPVIPSSSSQPLKYGHPSASGRATGTLPYASVWRKKDAVSDLRSATLENPYLSFVMRDHYTAYRRKSGTSDLESTEPKDPKRAFEGRYHPPTKGAPWEYLSRQPTEASVEDFGRNNNHVPAGRDSRTQSNQVAEVGKEAKKDDRHMSLSEAKKLINSFNARDWLQKNSPSSKNGPAATKKLANSLNMPGTSYAEAHQHKKLSPERLKEKWVANIGAKGKEKAVVGTVFAAENRGAGQSKNVHLKNEDVEEPNFPEPPQDDSTAEAPVEEVNDVAEHGTAELSGDKNHAWRSGSVRVSAAFKERVKHARPLSTAQMNARSSKLKSRGKWTLVSWIVLKAEHMSATPSTDKDPPPLSTPVSLPIYYGTRPPSPEVDLLPGWKLAQAMPVFDGPLTTPVLDPDFYGSKVASFRKGNDELSILPFHTHNVKEINAARGNRSSGYHTKQQAALIRDLEDEEKTAEELERLWRKYFKRLHKEPVPELPPRNRSTLPLLVGRRAERRGLRRLQIARLDKVEENVEYARDVERLVMENMKETYNNIIARSEEIELPVGRGTLDPSYEVLVRLGFNITHTRDLPDPSYCEDAVDGYDLGDLMRDTQHAPSSFAPLVDNPAPAQGTNARHFAHETLMRTPCPVPLRSAKPDNSYFFDYIKMEMNRFTADVPPEIADMVKRDCPYEGDDVQEWRDHVSKMFGPVKREGYGLQVGCLVWLTFEDDLERVLGEVLWVSTVWMPESFLGEEAWQSALDPLAADWLEKLGEISSKEDYRSYALRGRNERCAVGCCASSEPRIELPQKPRSFSPVNCTPWYNRMQRKPVLYIQELLVYIEWKERETLPSSRRPSLDFEIGDIEDASEESRKEESQPTSPVWTPNGPAITTIPAQLSPRNTSRCASSVESRTSPQPETENSGVISAVGDVVCTEEKQGSVLQSDEVDSSRGGGLAELPSQSESPEWATRIKQALDRNEAELEGVVIGSDAESVYVDRQLKGGNDLAKSPVEGAHTLPEGISTQKRTVDNAKSAAKELTDFPMPPAPVTEPEVEGVAVVGSPPMKDASILDLLHRMIIAKANITKEENKTFSSFENQLASIRQRGVRMASMTPTVQSLGPKLPSSQSKLFIDITAGDVQAFMEDQIRLAKEFWCSGRQTEGLPFAVVTSSPVASPSPAAAKQKPEVTQLADGAMPPTPQQRGGMSQEARVEAPRTREKGMQRKSDAIEREENRTFFSLDDQLSSIEQRLSWLKKLALMTEQYRATKTSLPEKSIRPPTPKMVWDLTTEGMEAYKKRHIGLVSKAWPPSLPVQGPATHAGTPSSAPVSALEEQKSEKGSNEPIETPAPDAAPSSAPPVPVPTKQKSEKGPMAETAPSHVVITSPDPVPAPPEQKPEQGPIVDGGVFFEASSETEHGSFGDRIRPTKLRSLIRRDWRHIAKEESQTFRSLADELESIRRRSFFMSCLTNTIRALRGQRPEDEMVATLEETTSAEIAEYFKRHTRLAPAAATLTTAEAPPATPVSQPVEKEVTPFDAWKLKVAVPVPPRTIYAPVTVPKVNSYAGKVQRSGDAKVVSANFRRFTRVQNADDQFPPIPPVSSVPVLVPAVSSMVNSAAVQPSGVVQTVSRAENVEELFPPGRPVVKLPRKSAAVQPSRSAWITEEICTGDLMGLRGSSGLGWNDEGEHDGRRWLPDLAPWIPRDLRDNDSLAAFAPRMVESATVPAVASPSIEAAASNSIKLSTSTTPPKEPGHKHTGILRATEGRTQDTAVTVAGFRKPVKVSKRKRNEHQRLRHTALVRARKKRRKEEKRLALATEHKTDAAEPSSVDDLSDTVNMAAAVTDISKPKRKLNEDQRRRGNVREKARRKRRNGEKRLACATEHKTHAAELSSSGDPSDAAFVVRAAQSMAEVVAAAVLGLWGGGDPEWNDVSKPAASSSSPKIASLGTSRPAASTTPPEQSGLEHTANSTRTRIEAESTAAAFADFGKPESNLSEYQKYQKCRWAMHFERVRQKQEKEEKRLALATELKRLATEPRSSGGPLTTVVVVPIAELLAEAAAAEPCSCSAILDAVIASLDAEIMRIEREGREGKAPSGIESNVSEREQTPAEVDPPEASATSQIIAAEGEISLRGGAPNYFYGQGIDKHGSDDWERKPHPKTGLLCHTKRGSTSQFEASQAPSPPPKRRVYTYPSPDVERVSQTAAQAGILARLGKEAVVQSEISLVRSLLSEGPPLNPNFIPLGVKRDPGIQREVASQKAMSRQYGSIVEDSLVQDSFGDFPLTRRYAIPEILHVLKAETQKYEYKNDTPRRQGQLEYTVPFAMDSSPKPGFGTTCVESTAEEVAVPRLSETAIRLRQALKQALPQLDDHATTEGKIPAKNKIAEHLGLRGGAPELRPSGQGIACVFEVSSKEYEYDSKYPLLGPNQHPADYLVQEQKRNYTNYRIAIAAGIVDDAGIIFERIELEERGPDLAFEPPTCLNGNDGVRGGGLEAGRPTGRLPKFEITRSKRPMDTPISHLQHGKSHSQALAQRDTQLKARGARPSQYPGHLSAQFSSARPKTQPKPRIWAASGASSAADYSGRHQTLTSGPSICGPSCCNWHTEGWMMDGPPGMNNGKSAPSPPLADWSGIATTLPVMVHMVSSYNIPHNITPELHNLSPTDSFLLFPKHGQGNPAELEQLHLWERLMAAELEDFNRQARESPPMASDRGPLHPNLAGLGYAKIVGHGGKGRYETPKEECSSPEWHSSSEASTSTRATSVEDGAGVSKRRKLDDFAVDTMDEWDSEWCSSDHSPHAPKSPKGSRKTRRRADSDEDWAPIRGGALNADGHGHPYSDDHSNAEDEESSHGDDAERSVTPIAYMTGRRFARRRPNVAPARRRQNAVSLASGAGLLSLTGEEAEQEPTYLAMGATARWVGNTEISFGEHTASVPGRPAPAARASLTGSYLPIAAIYSSSLRALSPMRPTTELEVAEDTRSEVTDGEIWEFRGFPQTPSDIIDSLSPDHPLAAFTRNARLEANAADLEEEEAVYQRARPAAGVAQVAALWLRYDSRGETPPWEEMHEALGLPHSATQEDSLDDLYRESEVLRHLFAGFQRYREENASDHPLAALFTEDTGLRTNDLDIEEGEIYDLAPGDFNIGFEIPPFSPLEHPRIPPGATPSEISAALWEADEREDAQEREILAAYVPRLEAIRQHGRTATLAEMCEALGLSRTATMADVRQELGTRIAEAGSRLMEARLHQRRQAENDRQAARAEDIREERRERHADIRAGASRWGRPPPSDLSATDSRSPSTISLERVLAEEYSEEQAAAAEATQEAAVPPSPTDSIDLEEPITFAAGGLRVGDAMAARDGHVEVLSDGWDNPLNPSSPTAQSDDGLFQGNPLRTRTPNPGLGQQVLDIMRRNNPAQFRQLELLRITQPPRDHPATRTMTFGEHLVSGVPRNRQPSTPVMSGALFPRGSPGAAVNGVVTLGRDIPRPGQLPMWMRSFEHTFPTARIGGIACDRQTYIQSLIHCTAASGHGAGERGGVPEGAWYVCTFRRRLTERPKRMSNVPLLRFGRISIDHDHVNRSRDTYNSDVESDEDEEFTFCEWEALFPACAVKDMLRSTDASWGVKAMRARNWALEEMDTDPKSDGCCEALGEWWERVRGVNGAAGDCRVRKVDVRVLEP